MKRTRLFRHQGQQRANFLGIDDKKFTLQRRIHAATHRHFKHFDWYLAGVGQRDGAPGTFAVIQTQTGRRHDVFVVEIGKGRALRQRSGNLRNKNCQNGFGRVLPRSQRTCIIGRLGITSTLK